MQFKKASDVEQVCNQMRLADWQRSQDRALIDRLMNGHPPYSKKEEEENNLLINVNDLSGMRMTQNARSQFGQNFLKPGQFFTAKTDYGKPEKHTTWSSIVTRQVNKVMKRSLDYYECYRSKFALDILHGVGPAIWPDSEAWAPDPIGIDDLLIPSRTLISFKNLPFFAIRKSFTAPELIKLYKAEPYDPGWNKELIKESIAWIRKQSEALLSEGSYDFLDPQKTEESLKEDGSLYAGDAVPTLDVFDFYYWSDEGHEEGWRRRMIIDAWKGSGESAKRTTEVGKSQFLYDTGAKVYARKREHIFSCQFADLSAVAPFRYHSVRSLGFLLYSVCHLQNRLRCRFNEAVFEALTMYFRASSDEDVQMAMKANLVNRGFIDKSLEFVPANERFQVNHQLVQLGLAANTKLIEDNVSSFRTNPDYSSDNLEKTKFQVMAELNSQTQLVSAGIQQAYQYQTFEYIEIFRRFLNRESKNADILTFRNECLKQGVPEKLLNNPDAWEIDPERVIGGGNKSMEMAIAQQMMQIRNAYDPDPQRKILYDVTLALTDDPARARDLVPEMPEISSSIHDAQLAFGTLMAGAVVSVRSGVNRNEYIMGLLTNLAMVVQRITQTTNMPTIQELLGLQNVAAHIEENIQVLAQDENAQQEVKQFSDQIGKMQNILKGFAQRLAESQESQGNEEEMRLQAELEIEKIKAQAKADNQRQAHAQRTAERKVSFENEQDRKDADLAQRLQHREAEAALERRLTLMEQQLKMLTQPKPEKKKTKTKTQSKNPS